MDHSLRLAALASAAVPGLDPMSVQEVVLGDDELFDVAFIEDTQQRRWVIRAPRTEVAAAHLDASLAMLALLVRRVPFAVPAAKGFAPIPKIGRAAVHAFIPGNPLDLAALAPGHPVTAQLGRTIALIHNVDRALFDEAGLPSYDAETYRKRHLAEIDRGAATGRVPAPLLARWEEALDDIRLWRFAPTPVHGALAGSDVLVTFPEPADPTSATIRGVTGWDAAKVADPADDFAALIAAARPEVVDAVLRAYAHVRVERPDEHLRPRARLVSELALLGRLLQAVASRNDVVVEATTARLRRLDDLVNSEANARRLRIVPAPPVSGGSSSRSVDAETPAGSALSAAVTHDPDASSSADFTASSAPDHEPAADPGAAVDDATDVIDAVPDEVPIDSPGDETEAHAPFRDGDETEAHEPLPADDGDSTMDTDNTAVTHGTTDDTEAAADPDAATDGPTDRDAVDPGSDRS